MQKGKGKKGENSINFFFFFFKEMNLEGASKSTIYTPEVNGERSVNNNLY